MEMFGVFCVPLRYLLCHHLHFCYWKLNRLVNKHFRIIQRSHCYFVWLIWCCMHWAYHKSRHWLRNLKISFIKVSENKPKSNKIYYSKCILIDRIIGLEWCGKAIPWIEWENRAIVRAGLHRNGQNMLSVLDFTGIAHHHCQLFYQQFGQAIVHFTRISNVSYRRCYHKCILITTAHIFSHFVLKNAIQLEDTNRIFDYHTAWVCFISFCRCVYYRCAKFFSWHMFSIENIYGRYYQWFALFAQS